MEEWNSSVALCSIIQISHQKRMLWRRRHSIPIPLNLLWSSSDGRELKLMPSSILSRVWARPPLANKQVVPIITSGSAQAAFANFIMKIEQFASASRSRETTWSICLTQRDKYRIGHQSVFSAYQVLRRSVRHRQNPSDNRPSL
jgi:hypothetical protein